MVKSAQDVASDDAAAALNGSAMWGIFLQAEMGPCRVVIRRDIARQHLCAGGQLLRFVEWDSKLSGLRG
jgi:hypothetical protein